MPIVTTTTLPAQVQQTFDRRLLSTPRRHLIHSIPAMKSLMPRNGGRFKRFSRYNRLPTSPVPLGNTGVTPPATLLSRVDIDVQMQFYGQYIILNEQVTLQNQDNALTAAAARLGVSLRETEDQLIRDMLAGSAALINCVGGVNGDNPTEITATDVAVVVQALKGADAKTISEMIEGADKYGTAPVNTAYFALCDTNLSSDLQNVNGFTYSSQYPSQKNVHTSEWGAVQNLRFFTSSAGSVTANASLAGSDIYNIFCCGVEGIGAVEQDGLSAQMIYLPAQFSGPLALNASVGWKMGFASRILNDLWVLNLRTTHVN